MENITLHVRFAPDGTVAEISERPAALTPQQWFNKLSEAIGMKAYQTFAGGRGMFKVARDQVEALKAAAVA
ncbi:MAG: hypothetical protein E6614_15345 [Bradyrhizobium sp.]|jgi:hypothetical protein|uniref:Uncharacterized protein n=1 Tax=Bradyrhizobium denitrificans TaxID=2734912 RepID=A0ABS5G867_9BRAD|nr:MULTISPECIES: hypothetical protein [Bradyrhizobium]RTL95913.1 MAG: hypothetical protein EKK32_24005 [Bradyrhizobiaceae bacterium]ABQ37835.1 hypothetical protein BBta_5893 [Bradyrhizobium sp. BTAi1]MBR1137459.1 hypothetical protein [Bradyrhizobium denitrificans]MCL8488166.1 hypothetical protein [Bradyrhizobium denitrificans]MDU1497738.1 hypothetical protein [Bradyrhizobium sp.]